MARPDIKIGDKDPFINFPEWHFDRFGYMPTPGESERWSMVAQTEPRGYERFIPESPISRLPEQPNPDFFKPPY